MCHNTAGLAVGELARWLDGAMAPGTGPSRVINLALIDMRAQLTINWLLPIGLIRRRLLIRTHPRGSLISHP